MTFDDAIEILANSENNKLVKEGQLEYGLYRAHDVVGVLQELKKEYAQKIYLKKSDKEMLLYYLENANFSSLLERILASKTSTLFGVSNIENVPFYGLSEEDIMYAWLYPNEIERK